MAAKRKFSDSFHDDTDMVQNLLKYRASSVPDRPMETVSQISVTQDQLREVVDEFVKEYEGLDSSDETRKPNYSYTELIFLAIMRSPNFCLPISEIYRYIETRYSFFTNSSKEHWKNAIRRSLSKTKCFTKIALDNQKPRKKILKRSAYLWTVIPKSLLNFARGDYRPANQLGRAGELRKSYEEVNVLGLWEGCVSTLTNRIEAFRCILNNSLSPVKIFQLQICNFEDTNKQSSGSTTVLPFPPTFQRQETENGIHHSVLNPNDGSATDLSSKLTFDLTSPTSESSDSFCSTSPSNSSGYGTTGDISSPEHGNYTLDSEQLDSPFNMDFLAPFQPSECRGEIPEVQLSCLMNVPTIPEFQALEGVWFVEMQSLPSLPCIVDGATGNKDFTSSCLYESCTVTDIVSGVNITMEEKSILFEFLSF